MAVKQCPTCDKIYYELWRSKCDNPECQYFLRLTEERKKSDEMEKSYEIVDEQKELIESGCLPDDNKIENIVRASNNCREIINNRCFNNRARVETALGGYGVDRVYYMAHIENVVSIFLLGILSHNLAISINHRDIALDSVQQRRNANIDGTSRSIHDFVPLYFATHTPMQYVLTCGKDSKFAQRDLVFFDVNPIEALSARNAIFSDGNAACNDTKFYSDVENLSQIEWKIVHTRKCFSDYYKRKKMAEVLVPDIVPISCIKKVTVMASEVKNKIIAAYNICFQKIRERGVTNIQQITNLDEIIHVDMWRYYY